MHENWIAKKKKVKKGNKEKTRKKKIGGRAKLK